MLFLSSPVKTLQHGKKLRLAIIRLNFIPINSLLLLIYLIQAADIVPVVIDTDAGMDDAWAIFTILRAHRDPFKAIRLVGITCVDGNTKLDNVVVNVTRTLEAGNALDVSLIPIIVNFSYSLYKYFVEMATGPCISRM